MHPYQEQESVVEEKRQLDERLEKLNAFLVSKVASSLEHIDYSLLLVQKHYMSEYSRILSQRIARFQGLEGA